jgi:DNA polymerase (family X)
VPKREVPLPPIDDEVDPPSNAELARVLHEIGDMLEVKGELVFKTVAYHRAADAVERSPVEVSRRFRASDPPQIPGVGAAIADKLDELSRTGRLEYHERLLSEFPPTLLDLLRLPGLGPKTVRLIWTSLGIATLEDLQAAAEGGRLRSLRGLSEATEKRVLAAIEGLGSRDQRLLLNQAEAIIEDVTAVLSIVPGVRTIEPAGSFRRKRESIGDIDLLAETDDPAGLVERFVTLARADTILGRGTHKAAVRLGGGGPQIDLMIMAPGQAGPYRIHFTGSKEHNVRLRAIARDRGWSLSEYGFAKIGEDGEPLTGEAAELRTFATEAEAYAFLELPFIEPELREDRGEIEAARAGTLPNLVTLDDLRGDLHSHSDWTDGSEPIEVMAEAARRRGHAYQVLTDHTQSLAITRGLAPDRVRMQRKIVAKLNELYAAEEEAGTAPPETPPEGFRLLHGCELEIRADNRLDYDDDLLATYDIVVASLHVSRRQPRSELTARVLTAIRNPHVDVIAHPAGRMIGTRDDLDLDWDVVYREAARTGTALEINGSPHRLDLAAERARLAVGLGCIVAVNSDAHRTSEFDYLCWGITQARRAWIEPANVVNTRTRAELLRWAAER